MHSRIRATGLLALVGVTLPALAHHSFNAEFDEKTTIRLTGPVTKVEWFNPHIWVYLDVKDAEGKPQHWQCEGGAPNSLVRNGWTKNSLKQGDEITIDGYLAKDGSKTCNARKVTMADGTSVFAGSSAPNAK